MLKNFALVCLGAGLFILIIATLVLWFKGHINSGDIDFEKLSAYGAFISGICGALFTIAATVLVYLTFTNQKEELKKTTENAQAQLAILNKQNIESSFHFLINNLLELKTYINKKSFGGLHQNGLAYEVTQHFDQHAHVKGKEIDINDFDLQNWEELVIKKYKTCLGIFPMQIKVLKLINHIVSLINNNQLNSDNKDVYLTIMNSHINEVDIFFYIYYCIENYELCKSNLELFKNAVTIDMHLNWSTYAKIINTDTLNKIQAYDEELLKKYNLL